MTTELTMQRVYFFSCWHYCLLLYAQSKHTSVFTTFSSHCCLLRCSFALHAENHNLHLVAKTYLNSCLTNALLLIEYIDYICTYIKHGSFPPELRMKRPLCVSAVSFVFPLHYQQK